MADRNGGWRRADRETSIFSNDDRRGRRGYGEERGPGRERPDERGFFDRAGDEVRSWFGDDDAERRRERDARYDEARHQGGDRYEYDRERMSNRPGRGEREEPWGGGGDYGYGAGQSGRGSRETERGFGDYGRQADYGSRGGYGQGGGFYSGSRSFGGSRAGYGEERDLGASAYGAYSGGRGDIGRSGSWDENYRRWRDRQIEQLDREYDEYRRHRQQQFESDFDKWRTNRQGSSTSSATGQTEQSGLKGGAGATTAGGGTASATKSSTGSSEKETGSSERSRSRSGTSSEKS